jgi:hypothetical protein
MMDHAMWRKLGERRVDGGEHQLGLEVISITQPTNFLEQASSTIAR